MEEEIMKWYFTREQLMDTPSRRCGVDAARELSYRQQAANFIQDMGQRLQLSQLCINTAIIYMHRFYMYHSFTEVHRNKISISSLFLSAKVEEQPRKLEHVIKVAHACLHKDNPNLDVRSEDYTVKLNETVAYENILLQTLGFFIGIEHPHTYVVKVCQLVKASKDLAQTSYIMATTSLHMTTMCLQYKPTIVACVCIHLACKWSSYLIEKCSEGRDWFFYVDRDVCWELLEQLTQDFIEILERSPHRFKKKFSKEVAATVPRPFDPSQPGPSGINTSDITNHHAIIPIKNSIKKEKDENKVKKEKEELKVRKEKEEIKIKKEKEEVKIKKEEIKIKTEKDPSPGPVNTETNTEYREKKHVVIKKEYDGLKREENPVFPVAPPVAPTFQHQLPPHPMPNELMLAPSNRNAIKVSPPEKQQPPPLPQHHSQPPLPPPPPPPAVHIPNEHSSSKKSSKESTESSSSKKHKSKHVSKSKSSSSNHTSSNHSEPGIKVKIRKDIISLSGVDCNQKYVPAVKAETPQKPLKIKLPKPPPESPKVEKTSTPASIKIVLTKDKSGSGSYSTSHKSEHRESRKRSHSSVVPDGSHREHKNSIEPSNKHQKVEQHQKNHSGDQRLKASRHSSSHRSEVDKAHNSASSRLQYSNVNENSTFQNYSAVPNYQNSYLTPPPPLPKLKGHNMMAGKTNSNFPMQPPLPPPQPPPPPPPPEDI